ncbi:alpha/beta hydrolase [Streptomyces sp. ZYX-F-203]
MARYPAVQERGRRRGGRPGRWSRALLTVLLAASVVFPLSAAARPTIPAPAPADPDPVTARTLEEVYAAHRANAAKASRMAAEHGHDHRAGVERALADPARSLLAFDGRGTGLVTEVLGDLAHADRVAVLVPGSDTGLDTYGRFRATAVALQRQSRAQAPEGSRTAVVAWLGYETPGTVSAAVTTTDRAEEAAPRLRALVGLLRTLAAPGTPITLVCHSYGSVVCGRAAAGLDVTDIALLGSPGTGADTSAGLGTDARLWAARGTHDWVGRMPHVSADLFGTTVGFGTDPISPEFGARVFDAGRATHSDYFAPDSPSLTNLTRIVLGVGVKAGDA